MRGAKFVIYRIIGNPLPPRHGPEEIHDNLKFTLENEPDLPSCDKRWVLNRLIDPEVEATCVKLLKASGQKYHVIPFDWETYGTAFLDASGMPKALNPFARGNGGKAQTAWLAQSSEWILRHKSLAAINLNNARNQAIALGMADALWTLPLDGWCYFTAEAWDSFMESAARNKDALYGVLPLARVKSNSQFFAIAALPEPVDEPQIAFRRDAPDRFYEKMRYGNQNKSELLARLEVPGPWTKWRLAFWDTAPRPEAIASGKFFVGGRVYRLASGAGDKVESGNVSRFAARIEGVQRLVQQLDAAVLRKFNSGNQVNDFSVLQSGAVHPHADQLRALVELASAAVEMPIRSVLDKAEMAPGGNPKDYFSLPRYAHDIGGENQLTDGNSVEASIIGTQARYRYDRAAWHDCFAHASLLTASGVLCKRKDFLKRAAKILSIWFIDEKTSVNANARFAQWQAGVSGAANFAGLIDFRYLWTLPYLSRTLLVNGALSERQVDAIKLWATNFLVYLVQSEQGQRAIMAGNNIGTWTHLVFISLLLFTDNPAKAATQLNAASLRLAAQCDVIGMQSEELTRTRPLHYSLFNLTAWTLLANLGRSAGFDLWNYKGVEGQSICRMMHFIQNNMAYFQEYKDQPEKFADWFDALLSLIPATAADRSLLKQMKPGADRIWTDDADLGLPSHWRFFLLRT